jgi:hypothetical protein
MIFYLYGLFDPRKGRELIDARYIGVTKDTQKRLWGHIEDAKNNRGRAHKDNWIRSLLREGVSPVLFTLGETNDINRENDEIALIKTARIIGANLTNTTEGGDGFPNPSPEMRIKMGNGMRGRKMSSESKAKISAANKGKRLSTETKRKIGEASLGRIPDDKARMKNRLAHAGKKQTEEVRTAISLSLIGNKRSLGCKKSDEQKKKISLALKGNRHFSSESIEKMRMSQQRRRDKERETGR